ncbi:MAG: hypothetical protein MUO62_19605 [Anaerolineales bacterium]|nr:hypothetical protein [Anaerolineales bacterium]
MIIHQPEILQDATHTTVWAQISIDKKQGFFPEYVWYRVPRRYGEGLTARSDAFLIPALLAGMYFDENIEVRGAVSPQLAYHLKEYQFILRFRFPQYLKQIEIKYHQLKPMSGRPKGVGTTFSGGADSLFTLWKHLPQNQPDPDYQVTHVVFIKGFDILHTAESHYSLLLDRYTPWVEKMGLSLIPMETNIVGLTHQRLPLSYFHGPYIVAPAVALAGLFHRFYIPSSWDYHNLKKKAYASDPLVDALLSSETLDIINHGTTHRRVEKVAEIADWDLAHNLLFVCQEHRFEVPAWNCSRCEKCVRTMIPLFALGKLDLFKTFARPFRKNWEGLWWARKFSLRHDFVTEMFPFVKHHKPDFVLWLRIAAFLGYIRYFLVTRMPGFVRHWLRRFGYYVTRNEEPEAYELAKVTETIRAEHDHPRT